MTLIEGLREFFLSRGFSNTYWIAYSGGLDSHVLLALCAEIRKTEPLKLRAIHINHNLSSNAQSWSEHCERICKQYKIDYVEHAVQIDLASGDSLEEEAREKRYEVFASCLRDGDLLLTAHHQDDQAETVLLQLLRGAGLKGLAAMPDIKTFARGFHARPLLGFTRADLRQYANTHQLKWVDDESNHNIKLSRNFIRHEVMPLLQHRWPGAVNTISRSATHCAEAQTLLETFSKEIYDGVKGSCENTLSVEKLLFLEEAKQRLVLRTWINKLGFPLPNHKKIEAIRNDVLTANWDRTPCVMWDEVELRRYRDDLHLMRAMSYYDVNAKFTWNLQQPLSIPGIGVLRAKKTKDSGLRADLENISIRFRQGGEWVNVPNRGHHTLKNLMQEWSVPPWLRERIPLILIEEKCIGAIGYFLDPDYAAENGKEGWELVVEAAHLT